MSALLMFALISGNSLLSSAPGETKISHCLLYSTEINGKFSFHVFTDYWIRLTVFY